MTNDEIITLADSLIRVERGETEISEAALNAKVDKVALAEDMTALRLAQKILTGRPYAICSDNLLIVLRAEMMASSLNAVSEPKRFEIRKYEFVDMAVFYPRHDVRHDSSGPHLKIVK
jgi:hypothetical protein